MKCRHCGQSLQHQFIDLGSAPPSNAYLKAEQLSQHEKYFPLKVMVCDQCWLVQTDDVTDADNLFTEDYAYFSSTSVGWLQHAKEYCGMVEQRFQLTPSSFVVEIAANDGYLLKNFVNKHIPCLGIEPTKSTADAAKKLGIDIQQDFFSEQLAKQLLAQRPKADLILGNNVFAHVPDINDFTLGMKTLLSDDGVITLEFPHLLELIDKVQFDTIYHEHFSYLSLTAVKQIFERSGLLIFDVEKLATHGGSLRVFGAHPGSKHQITGNVDVILEQEQQFGLTDLNCYASFQAKVDKIKYDLFRFLLDAKQQGKKVMAYGAAAKGNTLLNFSGIKTDLLPVVVDAANAKQNKFLPGSHIPICEPNYIQQMKPDYLIILPWNIASEVMQQQKKIKEWGCKFVTVIPQLIIH